MIEFIGSKSTHIGVAREILAKDVCEKLISECKYYYGKIFEPGPTLGGVNKLIKSSMDFRFSDNMQATHNINSQTFAECHASVNTAIMGALSLYMDEFMELHHTPNIFHTGFRLQHYMQNSGYYRRHQDGDQWTYGPETRVLAIILYLNDVERGGETEFPEHNLKVPARAGDIALFPTNWTHPHCGRTPVSGDKWIISSFVCVPTPTPTPKTFQEEEEHLVEPLVVG